MPTSLVSVKTGDIEALTARLRGIEDEAPDAMVRALNRSRTAVLARLMKWLVAATGIRSARLRRSIRTTKATRQQLNASVSLYASRSRLIDYDQRIQRANLPAHGFKAKMPASGHVGFFERAPGARHRRRGEPFAPHALPIREIMGPRFTEFIGEIGLADLLRYGGERLRIELERELAFRETRKAA